MCSGVLIDLDHVPDFLIHHGIKKYRMFFWLMTGTRIRKIYLVLHSFELIVLLWIAIAAFSLDRYWVSAAVGFTQHMLLDAATNPIRARAYFFIYRSMHRFETARLLRKRQL